MCDPTISSCPPVEGAEATFTPLNPPEPPNQCPVSETAGDGSLYTSGVPISGPTAQSSLLSPGQTAFFGQPVGSPSNDRPVIPPSLIDFILRPLPHVERPDNQPLPPPQGVITINDRTGLLEITNQYDTTVQRGLGALAQLEVELGLLSFAQDPQLAGELERLAPLLGEFGEAAEMVRDVHTRNGLTEYSTISNWANLLWSEAREAQDQGLTLPLRLEGVMLGFNLANINKHDPTYRTGTAVKLLIEATASQVASEWGVGHSMGMWGTNVVVEGIPESRVEEFHATVQNRVVAFLAANQELPEWISRQLGSTGLRTTDLPARAWLVNRPANLGLTAGHQGIEIASSEVRPGGTELRIIEAIEGMAEAEMEARRVGRGTFTGPIPADSPVHGRAGRPLLRTGSTIPEGISPEGLRPFGADPTEPRPPLTIDDVTTGRLPRPAHEAGHSIRHGEELTRLLSDARSLAAQGDAAGARVKINQALEFLHQPEASSTQSVSGFLSETYEFSLEQHRFPGVFRLEMFPEIARRVFGGERFFVQMAEYRDYWGHNQTHRPDAGDSMHRLTIDLLVRGYEYHGVTVLVGTQGGDEVFFAIRGKTADGRELTDTDIGRISDYLGTHFNRLFQNITHHEAVKVPPLPGGRFAGRNYVVRDGRLIVERGAYNPEQIPELLRTVETAYGTRIDPAHITEVDSLSEVAQVERWRLWTRVDEETGRVIDIFRPIGETPPGYAPREIPLTTTITSAVEVPEGSAPEVVRLAMDRAGAQADEMKREGIDRPRSDPTSSARGPEPVIRMSLIDRFEATRGGRLYLGAGLFGVGDVVSEGIMHLVTGHSRLGTFEYYQQMVTGYLTMVGGSFAGEGVARTALAAFDSRLLVRQGERLVLNQSAFRAEYQGLRGLGVRGSGMLGAVLLLELAHSGRIDLQETGAQLLTMGTAMGITRGIAWAGGSAWRALSGMPKPTGGGPRGGGGWGAVVMIIGEMLIMKAINEWRQDSAIEAQQGRLRGELGQAMSRLDHVIAATSVVDEQGNPRPTGVEAYQTAVRGVTEAFGNLLTFQMMTGTDEGRDLMEAQGEAAKYAQKLSGAIERAEDDYPEIREIRTLLRDNPSEGYERYQQFLRADRERAGKMTLGLFMDWDSYFDGRAFSRAVEDLREAETTFQTTVRTRFAAVRPTSDPVPLHRTPEAFVSLIRDNPDALYNQFANYLTSRLAYADQVAYQGGDLEALRRHYPEELARPVIDLTITQPPVIPGFDIGILTGEPVRRSPNSPFTVFSLENTPPQGAVLLQGDDPNRPLVWNPFGAAPNPLDALLADPSGSLPIMPVSNTSIGSAYIVYTDGVGSDLVPLRSSDQIVVLPPEGRSSRERIIIVDPRQPNAALPWDQPGEITTRSATLVFPSQPDPDRPIIVLDSRR